MRIIIKKVFDSNKNETGAILIAGVNRPTNALEKSTIENQLVDFAFTRLYPREGLNIFSEINEDTPSIVVIRKINDLPNEEVDI